MGSQLISLYSLLHRGQVQIVPYHILGLIKGTSGHLAGLPGKAGKMIAIKDDGYRLFSGAQPLDQFLDKFVHFPDLAAVIFKIRIGAMSLDGYGIDKILTFRRIQRIDDLVRKDLIPAPPDRVALNVIHVFDRRKGIKAQLGKYPVPVIKSTVVVVDGVGGIAQRRQVERNALAYSLSQHGLIWVFPWAKKVQVHPGNAFKLRIRRSRPYRRHV